MKRISFLSIFILTAFATQTAFGGLWLSRQINQWTTPKDEYDPKKLSPFSYIPDDVLKLIIAEAIEQALETGQLEDIQNVALVCKKFARLLPDWIKDIPQKDKKIIQEYLEKLPKQETTLTSLSNLLNQSAVEKQRREMNGILSELIQRENVSLKALQIIILQLIRAGASIQTGWQNITIHNRHTFTSPLALDVASKNAVQALLNLGALVDIEGLQSICFDCLFCGKNPEIFKLVLEAYKKQHPKLTQQELLALIMDPFRQ